MGEHRASLNKENCKNMKLYHLMKEYGKEHFKIELIEECKCENSDQLKKKRRGIN